MKRANYNRTEENQNNSGRVTSNSLKTKNSNEMKTENNVQLVILKSLAVVASLGLISLTVNAQDYWKSLLEKYNFNEIELAMVENNTAANRVESDANGFDSFLEPETEEALQLENWMIDESNFTTFFSIDEEIENPLNLEDWMTNEALFNTNSIYLEVETEGALELENWMTDANNFEVSTIQVIEEPDTELALEVWMLKDELFARNEEIEQPLELEAWMVSENIW